jgi:hypothetical protein
MALITTSFVVVFSLQGRAGRACPLFFIFSFLFFWGIIGGEIIKGFKGKRREGEERGDFLLFSSPATCCYLRQIAANCGSLSCCGLISPARHSLLPL